ncbi:MAG: flavodoxin-dependent (E)-4-hydroxy-3-methylbut-2-enyl-diphosphate synthase [Clostridia bacterium]|nr:flavodoxin-dependent (E)-4-hydroxy-3-methylbut-2-enyl-diphosphate synthase [Clostridia bacterium]
MSAMSRKIKIGNTFIGGGESVKIQTMSTFKISKQEALEDAIRLEKAGCDILRYSVLDEEDALSFKKIKEHVKIPLVADIHFDYKLALKSIEGGADKIRINPGNIGEEKNVKAVADALKEYNIPVRVGSNTGSIEKEYLSKYGKSEISLGESALKNVSILEKYGVENIVISVKASNVPLTVKSAKYIASKCDYPLHIGVTEAGAEYNGVVKNSIAIGSLLLDGIGDTIRVSLSADPERELVAGKSILKAVGLLNTGVEVVACPTCGRCVWNCMRFASKVENYTKDIKKPLKIAVMGCAVNGPGEAKDCDLGVAGGIGGVVIFSKGQIIKKVKEQDLEKEFFAEIDKWVQ